MDLRQKGHPFEKTYIEFTHEDIVEFSKTYHNWISKNDFKNYENIKEYCHTVKKEELKDYSLVASKYIEFNRNVEDIDFDYEMKNIQQELQEIFEKDIKTKEELKKTMEEIGYGI